MTSIEMSNTGTEEQAAEMVGGGGGGLRNLSCD